MNIEEVYKSRLWQDLMKNNAFNSKFFEVMRRAKYYVREEDLKLNIEDDKLIISYSTPIQELQEDECISDMRYEFSIDKDGNLILDEKFGTITTNNDESYLIGGTVDTQYTCSLYDADGIEMSNQTYSDCYNIKSYEIKYIKDHFSQYMQTAYNPSLIYYVNSLKEYAPKPGILGDVPKYIRREREKDTLGLVNSVECEFLPNADFSYKKHLLYFNTFSTHQLTFQPEAICVESGDPFAIVDEKGNVTLNRRHAIKYRLNLDNYKQRANDIFLDELKQDREQLSIDDIEARYDFIIGILEDLKQNKRKN